jgi:hypothetical protein
MITVAFVHVGSDVALPTVMVASVRRVMSGARIVQLTDIDTAEIARVDEVVRLEYDGVNLMTYRLQHFAQLAPCDVVFLDTDVIVQKDLGDIFGLAFDVALTRRDDAILDPAGRNASAAMPYNTGVMVSRPSGWDFWLNAWTHCRKLPADHQRWWGDQLSVHAMATVCPLQLRQLPCAVYNYTPSNEVEDVRDRFVVHYKGKRKAWMLSRARAEFNLSA